METVAVVGLGRVGLPLALSLADRGHPVIGVERGRAVRGQLSADHMHFSETGTQEQGRIGQPEGIAGTVEWLREQRLAARGG